MLNKEFQLFIWIFFPILAFSQQSKIDSLEQVLASDVHDSVRMKVLDHLFAGYYYKNSDKSLAAAQEMLEIAERNPNSPTYLCKAYDKLGLIHLEMQPKTDSAQAYWEKAMACYEDNNHLSGKAYILGYLGYLYRKKGLYFEALSFFQESLTLSEELNDTSAMFTTLSNLTTLYESRREYEKGLKTAQNARAYAKATNCCKQQLANVSNNMANIYSDIHNYDSALVLYEESIAIYRELEADMGLIVPLANIGGIYIRKKQYQQADPYLEEAYTLSKNLNHSYGKGLTLQCMTSSALGQQQYEAAIQFAYQGLLAFGPHEELGQIRDLYASLSKSYEALNQADSALAYLKLYQTLNDSIFHSEKEEQIQQLEISYQVKQKELENQLLKAEQSYIEKELKNRTSLSIGLIIALFLACGWGFSVYRNNQAKKRMNNLLEEQVAERTEDLQIANKQLQQANYELKTFNYIASHDIKEPIRNVGNYVSLIYRRLPDQIKEEMLDYFQIITQSANQLYTLIEDFASYTSLSKDDSTANKEINLNALISSIEIGLASFIEQKNGMVIVNHLPTIYANSSLLFVALKNLIENGLKFNTSEVPRVEISCEDTRTHHLIKVSDNGIGIDSQYHEQIFIMFKRLHNRAEYQGSGIGLALVRLVMEKLEGEVSLESTIDHGSTFVLSFPK